MSSTDTTGDVVLAQLVRYASNQWDSAQRFSTRAGGIIAIGGTVLAGSIALLAGTESTMLLVEVAGWILVVASMILAGWGRTSSGWKTPPNLSDASLSKVLKSKAEAVKQGLVLDYAEACRINNRRLRAMRIRQDIALAALAVGALALGLAHFVSTL